MNLTQDELSSIEKQTNQAKIIFTSDTKPTQIITPKEVTQEAVERVLGCKVHLKIAGLNWSQWSK